MKKRLWILLIVSLGIASSGKGQSTVFSILQDQEKLAEKSYKDGNYAEAISLYQRLLDKKNADQNIRLKLAQCYYFTKNYEKSVSVYDSYLEKKGEILPWKDMYTYAEAQSVLGNYSTAIENYKKCLDREPNNEIIAKKIWRLNNINYLYEDSAHFSVWPVRINTSYGELCPVLYKNGIVFTSNRKTSGLVEKVNAKLNTPFYRLYNVAWKDDTTGQASVDENESAVFGRTLRLKYNMGPVAFYNSGSQMVLVATSEKTGASGNRNLGLYFASLQGKKWKLINSYPYNSDDYSITDVTISEDGTTMYFSSDMKGGAGGKDIYVSRLTNNKWSKPSNAGEAVNTNQNEVFPYLHASGSLYFSSDGHPGFGGLDIFKAQIKPDGFTEPQNVGYPLNSSYDDFGMTIDSLGKHGYFTSNRKNGGYDDDIYEFDMDLRTYPYTITGVIKYKEHTWSETAIRIWPNMKIALIDSWRGTKVYETTTDVRGNFTIAIPYFSKYYIQIIDEEGIEHKASLEIVKHRTETNVHEIVVVKDIFKENANRK